MNEREVAELRRRFRQDRSGISHIRGCYVNENREIISQFDQSLGVLTQEENEKLLQLLRRVLSGSLGKNLLDITFATQQVVHGAEHKRLMDLRASELKDEEAVRSLFQAMIQSLDLEGNYMILLAHDTYDVPYRGRDGEDLEDASEQVFSYILCAVCPVKLTKPALSYRVQEGEFHASTPDWVVAQPELGFLFPSFDDRSANIYDALYYSKDVKNVHEDFVGAVFDVPAPMPAAAQQEHFHAILSTSLEDDCSLPVIQAVHNQLCGLMEDHKESRNPELLTIGKGEIKQALAANNVSQEHILAFEQEYSAIFGTDTHLSPRNLINPKKMELKTGDVTIQVNPDRSDLVQTKQINGINYILIRVEDGVEINGTPIQITESQE